MFWQRLTFIAKFQSLPRQISQFRGHFENRLEENEKNRIASNKSDICTLDVMIDFHWKNEANRWRSEICLIRSYADSLLSSLVVVFSFATLCCVFNFNFLVSRFLTLRVESDGIPDEGIVPQLHNSKKICCRTKIVNISPLSFSCANNEEKKDEINCCLVFPL